MGVAEIDEQPLALEIGVGDGVAVLVDELERAADGTAEQCARRTLRAAVQFERDERPRPEDREPGEQCRRENQPRPRPQWRRPLGNAAWCIAVHYRPSLQCCAAGAGPAAPTFSTATSTVRAPAFSKVRVSGNDCPACNGFISPVSMMCMPPGAKVTG